MTAAMDTQTGLEYLHASGGPDLAGRAGQPPTPPDRPAAAQVSSRRPIRRAAMIRPISPITAR